MHPQPARIELAMPDPGQVIRHEGSFCVPTPPQGGPARIWLVKAGV